MIPQLIHFVWTGPPMPEWAKDNIRLFQELNPQFICKVHGEKSLLPFLEDAYWKIKGDYLLSRRSDVLRISVLLQHGGWYFDTDFLPIRPLTELYGHNANFTRGTFLAPGDAVEARHRFSGAEKKTRKLIANGIIGTTADSAFLACVLRGILMGNEQQQNTWDCYGPRLFTEVVEQYPAIAHIGNMDDWFRFDDIAVRRATYRRIREGNYSKETIDEVLGDFLPYAFHQSMQERVEL